LVREWGVFFIGPLAGKGLPRSFPNSSCPVSCGVRFCAICLSFFLNCGLPPVLLLCYVLALPPNTCSLALGSKQGQPTFPHRWCGGIFCPVTCFLSSKSRACAQSPWWRSRCASPPDLREALLLMRRKFPECHSFPLILRSDPFPSRVPTRKPRRRIPIFFFFSGLSRFLLQNPERDIHFRCVRGSFRCEFSWMVFSFVCWHTGFIESNNPFFLSP